MKPPHTRSHAAAVFWIIASLLACTLLTPAAPASPPSPSTPPEAVPTEPPNHLATQLPNTPTAQPSSRAWQPAGFGGAGSFLSVHFDPNQPGVVYAASDVAGVMRSTDYGDHWEIRSIGLGNYEIDSFAVDPFDSNTLYVGVGALRESNHAGVYVSHDAGLSWQHLENTASNSITFRRFRTNDAIALDPAREGVIISGSREGGLWRSTDSGRTWDRVFEAASTDAPLESVEIGLLPDDPTASPYPAPVFVVVFDPSNTDIVYASLDGAGVIKSVEGGVAGSWEFINNGLPDPARVKYVAVGRGVIYAALGVDGVYRSDDGGGSWRAVSGALPLDGNWVSSVAAHPADPDIAYLTLVTYDHPSVWKTTDGGATWEAKGDVTIDPANDPTEVWATRSPDGVYWPHTYSWQVTLDPRDPNRLYYVDFWRIARSDDGGEHWAAKIAGAQNTCVTDLTVDADTLYATHWDAGLLTSTDHGSTWKAILPSEFNDPVLAGHYWRIVITHTADAKYYFTTSDPWETDYGQVLHSRDGVNWTPVFQNARPTGTWLGGMMLGLAADPSQPSTLYVTQDGGEVFKSTDNGETWTPTNGQPDGNSFTYALAVDEAGRIFAGTISNGLWRSTDGGGSWEQVLNEQSTIFHALAVSGAVYASAGDGNLYRSTDGGDSWQQLTDFPSEDDGDGVGQQGMAIAVDPNDPDHIFFSRLDAWHSSDAGSGVVESTDGGLTWTELNDGLRLPKVSVMTFGPGGTLYAGTNCGGVWRLRMRP